MAARECPTCGESGFESRRGVRTHHSLVHDEPLTETIVCDECGEEFEVRDGNPDDKRFCSYDCVGAAKAVDRVELQCDECRGSFTVRETEAESRRFCSDECAEQWNRERISGEGNPRWKGGTETVICEACGGEYEVRQALADDTRFCSLDCKGRAYAEEKAGANNPRWKGGMVTNVCEWCGDEYETFQTLADEQRFCSKDCHANHQTTIFGQEHPMWKGGKSLYFALRSLLGELSWEQRSGDVRADECCLCGADKRLDVHHIIPILSGGTNEPWNLMTLCRSCHMNVEHYTKVEFAPEIISELIPNDVELRESRQSTLSIFR